MFYCIQSRAERTGVLPFDSDVTQKGVAWQEPLDYSEVESLKYGVTNSFVGRLVDC